MRRSKFFICILLALLSAGCAVHPSPRDVMPRNTVTIVEHIKCETAFAIRRKVIDKLEHNNLSEPDKTAALKLAIKLRENVDAVNHIELDALPGRKAKDFYRRYQNTVIAYDFSLAASEQNTNSTQLDFARVITNGTVSVPFVASNDQIRLSTKTFFISETFKQLLTKLSIDCPEDAEIPNLEYPVSGSVGIYDIIDTFIELNEEKDLKTKPSAPGIYADALSFTTTVMGSVAPKLVLTPPTQAFHLTGALLNSAVTRKDTDNVNIGLSLPDPQKNRTTPAEVKDGARYAIERQRTIQVQNSVIQLLSIR